MNELEYFLAESVSRHNSLCPRQVLGVRIGLAGAGALGIDVPREDKKLLVIVETDGCFVSGVEVVTGCAVRHRTLRVEDYGKVAATFVDVESGHAVRVAPRLDIRQRAKDYAPDEKQRYSAMLKGYQRMPTESLLSVEKVSLSEPVESIVSRAGIRVNCSTCGEEIINERDIIMAGRTLCRPCAGSIYYKSPKSYNFGYNLLPSNLLVDDTANE
ncbi:MAG: TraR/DksA C4-type zinc finger protein [Anaerolineales bacterium]|uniref:TraR/DksA C4-type zinc finger protein n=1 Tax=Candidatus Desulfolinea nitratireducens TaxID=2841698 RepID=A0A8J6NPF1_9CHLR|nr:TraR/DksA C4-type zinc finger protein [Candidatus Desulfolinea nitratireducens]MBL6960068.1 TraR/DksA C4-type zinc finger protein [Anaerolineales bacterium]